MITFPSLIYFYLTIIITTFYLTRIHRRKCLVQTILSLLFQSLQRISSIAQLITQFIIAFDQLLIVCTFVANSCLDLLEVSDLFIVVMLLFFVIQSKWRISAVDTSSLDRWLPTSYFVRLGCFPWCRYREWTRIDAIYWVKRKFDRRARASRSCYCICLSSSWYCSRTVSIWAVFRSVALIIFSCSIQTCWICWSNFA